MQRDCASAKYFRAVSTGIGWEVCAETKIVRAEHNETAIMRRNFITFVSQSTDADQMIAWHCSGGRVAEVLLGFHVLAKPIVNVALPAFPYYEMITVFGL